MIIKWIPQRSDDPYASITVAGKVLVILTQSQADADEPATVCDFSAMDDGDTLPFGAIPLDLFAGPVTCEAGEVTVHLILPHGPAAPESTRFAGDQAVADGPVQIPEYGHA